MQPDSIFIKGARENNLKNIDLEIPRDKLVVITGLSGSGKSSLAFDTIYAEGPRRYVESLSSYARMFLGQMDKPDVDYIDGLSPAISIDQKTTSRNPRSTVGTVTEIYDYMRLLWARVGVPHCPKCGREIRQQSIDQIVDRIMALPQGTKFTPFSQSSFNLIYGGTGSGSMKADDAVSLRAALIEDFGEGCFNDNQWKYYATTKYKHNVNTFCRSSICFCCHVRSFCAFALWLFFHNRVILFTATDFIAYGITRRTAEHIIF